MRKDMHSHLIMTLFILLLGIISGCNNPNGGSVVSSAHTPLLKIPGSFTFSQLTATNGNITVSWKAAARASNYKIYMGTSSTAITTLLTNCNMTRRVCTISGLDPATTYYFSAVAENSAGTSNITSNESALSVGSFDFTSQSISDGSAILNWSSSDRASTYELEYGRSSGNYTLSKKNVTSPYTLSGLSNNVTYYARLIARNNKNGYILSTSEVMLSPNGPPAQPTGLSVNASPGLLNVTWSSVTGATSYKIFKGTSSSSLSEVASGIQNPHFADSDVSNGTTYFYKVIANNGVDSTPSAVVSAAPIASFNLTSVSTGPAAGQLTLTWPSVVGASNYSIIYGTSSSSLGETIENVTSPYVFSGLTGGTTYYMKVVASNNIGGGAFEASTNTLSEAPIAILAAPNNFLALSNSDQIDLSWSAISGVINYHIYRGTSPSSMSLLAEVSGTTYSDSSVSSANQYYYIIRSYNGLESADSSTVTAQTIDAFSISSVSAVNSTSITLTWPSTTGASSYDVLYRTTSTGSYTPLANKTSPLSLTGLTAGSTYYILVRARNTIGSSNFRDTSEVTQVTPLAKPAGLSASATPGVVNLSWTSNGASSYNVYRSITSGSGYAAIATNRVSSSYPDTSATPGTTYYYVVTANNGAESAYSSEVSIQSIASFSITSASATSSTAIQLNWPSVPGAATYDVKYGSTPGSYGAPLTNKTSPFTITGLTPGVTYYFVVSAKNTVGAGTTFNSSAVGAATAFGAPSGLTASSNPGDVQLNWNSVSGATTYKIYRDGSMLASSSTNSYLDTSVVNGTEYTYTVRADNGTESTDSNSVLIKPIDDFLTYSATATSSSSIDIQWTDPNGSETFEILYGPSSTVYLMTASNATSPYPLSGLTSGSTYYFKIRATNSTGAISESLEFNAQSAPDAPGGLVAVGGSGQISLTWNAVTGVSGYKVFRGVDQNSLSQIGTQTTSTNYIDSTASNGTTYFYAVKSTKESDSALSSVVSKQPIALPTLTATSASSSSINLSWANVSGAASYDIKYGASTSYGTTLTSVSSPLSISGLVTGTVYYFQLVAKNTIGGGTTITTTASAQPNSPPVITPSSIADQTMEADTNLVVNFSLTDANNAVTCTSSMSATSSDTSVVSGAGIVFTSASGSNCRATITPMANQTGTTVITLSASDGITSTQVAFNLAVTPCVVDSFAWVSQFNNGTNITAGSYFSTPPKLRLLKAGGSVCASNTDPVDLVISVDNSTSQDAVVIGTDSVIPVNGIVTFDQASIQRLGSSYTVAASQGDIISTDSNTFNVTAGPASKMIWKSSPPTTPMFATMVNPIPKVAITDAYGNQTATSGKAVTLTAFYASNNSTAGTQIAGTLTASTNASGEVSFSDLSFINSGSYYLYATNSTYGAVKSKTFSILDITPQNLVTTLEMLDFPIYYKNTSTSKTRTTAFPRSAMNFSSTNMDGSTSYKWRVVATSTSASTILSLNSTSSTNGSINSQISLSLAAASNPQVFEMTLNPSLFSDDTLIWSIVASVPRSTTIQIYSSTIIATQTGAKKTQVYIPFSSIENQTISNTTPAAYALPAGASYTDPADPAYFKSYYFSSSNIKRLDSARLWFSANRSSSSGKQACAVLYNRDLDQQIGTPVCISSSKEAAGYLDIGGDEIPDNTNLEIRFNNTDTSRTAKVFSAGLMLNIVSIERLNFQQKLFPKSTTSTTATSNIYNRILSSSTSYSGSVTENLECLLAGSGKGRFDLINAGTSTSGTSGTTISGSAITLSGSYASPTELFSGNFTTTPGKNYYLQYSGTGAFNAHSCYYNIDVIFN